MLLSCLSVAGGAEQRKLVGCGVSHVCLALCDSLLCYSLTYPEHSLWETCDPFAFHSTNSTTTTSILNLFPPLKPLLPPHLFTGLHIPPQMQVGLEQVESRPVGTGRMKEKEEEEEDPDYPPGKEVTARPAHHTPVPWRQGGTGRATHLSPEELAAGGLRNEL